MNFLADSNHVRRFILIKKVQYDTFTERNMTNLHVKSHNCVRKNVNELGIGSVWISLKSSP